jgi:hypothetical protein
MDRITIRQLFLYGLVSFIISINVYGHDPCVTMNSDCGNIGGGMGSCAFDGIACVGQCTSYCPSGSADKYCSHYWGDCRTYMGKCSKMLTYTCYTRFYGPPSCVCEETGGGNDCPRQFCR